MDLKGQVETLLPSPLTYMGENNIFLYFCRSQFIILTLHTQLERLPLCDSRGFSFPQSSAVVPKLPGVFPNTLMVEWYVCALMSEHTHMSAGSSLSTLVSRAPAWWSLLS